MATEKRQSPSDSDLLKLVVEEVDEAREVYELAQQLLHALPLGSFNDIAAAVGNKGVITFRGHQFDVGTFRTLVPTLLFPIDSTQKLITLLNEAVRLAPASLRYNQKDPATAKRRARRLGLLGLPGGGLGSRTGRVQ
jgi:hypothetical protein